MTGVGLTKAVSGLCHLDLVVSTNHRENSMGPNQTLRYACTASGANEGLNPLGQPRRKALKEG